jgi:hypothetical protein
VSEVVFTRDTSSGRIHRRVRDGDRLLVDERDNLDQAGAYEIVEEAALADVDAEAFCRHCFPEPTS